jgi:hypothetical protein
MTQPPPPPDGQYPPPRPGHAGPPGPPAYYPQLPHGAPPVAKKKSRALLIFGILGGLVALCCVGGVIAAVANGDGSPKTTGAADPSSVPNAAVGGGPATGAAGNAGKPAGNDGKKQPGLNQPVRDGKFEFTVTKVDCSKTRVGNEMLGQSAQGKFCLVSVTVKNIGKEAQLFDGSSQKAYDAKGTEFSNDGAAELYANEGASTFLNEINPGNQVKGNLLFDVPKATRLTAVELHDSPFSGGVRVTVA